MIHIDTTLPYVGVMDSCIGGRIENQDSCGFCETKYGLLLVVCDGMGGGPSGKLASTIAINEIIQFINTYKQETTADTPIDILSRSIQSANMSVYTYGQHNIEAHGMGTTVVAILINEEYAIVAHVGDSRCYQMRNGQIIFKTTDHSVVGELVRKGALTEEQARISPNSNVITRVLGLNDSVEIDIDTLSYEKKDRFYLCTDGVWGSMPESQLVKQFYRYPNMTNVIESTTMLIDEIGRGAGGHHDNHTLIIIETQISSKLKQAMSTKHKRLILGMTVLLVISLFINLITIFNRENNVAKMASLTAKDSIINKLNIDNSTLSIQVERLRKDSILLINQIESTKNELQQIKDINREISNKKQNKNIIKTISLELKSYLDKGNDKGLLAEYNYLLKHKKDESRDYILKKLEQQKNNFENIGESNSYLTLKKIVENYNKHKAKEVENIIDYILNKYK